jgi:fumarylacetoacetase
VTDRSWLPVPEDSPFTVHTLPYGVFSVGDEDPRVGVAIGASVLDLAPLAAEEGLDGAHVFEEPTLNPFMALGPRAWAAVRAWVTELVRDEPHRDTVEPHLLPLDSVRMHLPFAVADYVDFYSSAHHAGNVGRILRPDAPALPPAWRHLPIGYHGRAGTVVLSGTEIGRPCGLRREPGDDVPSYGPSLRLDVEAEIGFVVGVGTERGTPVPVDRFAEHVFGVVLVNDWSARDIQAFEYVPLGPFLGKSFATSVSPGSCRSPRSNTPASRRRRATPSRRPTCGTPTGSRGVSTSRSRSPGTARSCPGRRSPRCTGRPRSSSPTSRSTARRCEPATCTPAARSAAATPGSAAASWSSPGTARSR